MSRRPKIDDEPLDFDPDEFRRLGHQLIELMAEALETERLDPVLRHQSGEQLRARFDRPLPREGRPPEEVLAECGGDLLRYSRRDPLAEIAEVCEDRGV